MVDISPEDKKKGLPSVQTLFFYLKKYLAALLTVDKPVENSYH